jgi:hypothetical protein
MTRRVALAAAALAIATLAIALACGSDRITVATILEPDASIPCELADAGDAGDPCPTGTFCSATACGAQAGTCEAINSAGCESSEPECGCDGTTYFNQCLRQQAQVSLAAQGACDLEHALPCPHCKGKASCAAIFSFLSFTSLFDPDGAPYLENASIGINPRPLTPTELSQCLAATQTLPAFPGFCWVLPPDGCPSASTRTVLPVLACGEPCIDECSAIRDGGLYVTCESPDASIR